MRAKNPHGLSGLHEERFIIVQRAQGSDDGVKTFPIARGLSSAAVDDEIVGALGYVGIEIVHQHAQRGFLLPAFAGKLRTAWRANCGMRSVGGRHSFFAEDILTRVGFSRVGRATRCAGLCGHVEFCCSTFLFREKDGLRNNSAKAAEYD